MNETLASAVGSFIATSGLSAVSTTARKRPCACSSRFADGHGVSDLGQLTPGLLDEFLASRPRPRPRSFNHLLGIVGCVLGLGGRPRAHGGVTAARTADDGRRSARSRSSSTLPRRVASDAAAALARQPQGSTARPDLSRRSSLSATGSGLQSRRGVWASARRRRHERRRPYCAGRQVRQDPPGPTRAAYRRAAGRPARAPRSVGALRPDAPLFSFGGRPQRPPGTASQRLPRLVIEPRPARPRRRLASMPAQLASLLCRGCLLRWYREGLDPARGSISCRPSWATSTRPRPRST